MRILALLAAAIMIAIHALRLIMSQEPADRKNAKESIWFVILGTLIIIIASGLVGYLYVGGVVC
jgi:small-conductance mechanosensitive channel